MSLIKIKAGEFGKYMAINSPNSSFTEKVSPEEQRKQLNKLLKESASLYKDILSEAFTYHGAKDAREK